jgi:hypothetical protein
MEDQRGHAYHHAQPNARNTMTADEQEARYQIKNFSPLIGKTVKAVVRDGGSEWTEEFFGLEFTDGTVAWVLRDPEGNGRGHLQIEKP